MPHSLETYAYSNRLKHLPPQQKLSFATLVLLTALMAHPVTQAMIIGWLWVWTMGYARIPIKVYGRVFFAFITFLLMSLSALILEVVPVNQMTSVQINAWGGLVLGNGYLFVSHSGVLQAMAIGMRSLACSSCLLFILFTIPFTELLLILRQYRIPTVLLDLLLLMYRFIFLFLEVATQLQLAQRARGGYRTRQRWIKSVGLLIGQLVVRSLQQYHHFSLGLAARGFNGNFRVYSTQSYTYSKRYALEACLGCLGLILFDLRF